jgi:putative copper resistance protein D
LLTGALELMAMAGNMGDSWRSAFDPQILSAAVTDTTFGRVWVGRLALAVVVVGLCVGRRSGMNPLLFMASGALLASVALTGHSAIPGGPVGLIHQVTDAAHLLAAGWWVGGLLALVLAAGTLGDQASVVLGRFSRIGYAAVAVIIASGLIKSVILVGHWSALATSAYGWVLLAKIGLFAGMGLLALSNRFQITPALASGADPQRWMARLRRQVAVEFALALLVLAVVGALGAMQPPISQ